MSAAIRAIAGMELKKTFGARRALWIYLLAFGPAFLYLIHAVHVTDNQRNWSAIAASHPLSGDVLRSFQPGMTVDQVEARAGQPYDRFEFRGRRGSVATYRYTDGSSNFTLAFFNGALLRVSEEDRCTISTDSALFATVFQFFYLRLAVFFGCVGIFTNLFRGEMLDKSLHYYLLAPVRREVLMFGKFLAGLIVAVSVFTAGTALQFLALSWHYPPGAVAAFLAAGGWSQIAAYLGVTALACLGYGSIFLAAGMLFRNPIFPAAGVLLWESINLFLPAALKKISVIFYLQSLCPVVAAPQSGLSLFERLLISSAEPAAAWAALSGLLVVTAVVLALAAWRARKLEINYATD